MALGLIANLRTARLALAGLALAGLGLALQPLGAQPEPALPSPITIHTLPRTNSTVTEISKVSATPPPAGPKIEPSPRIFLSADGETIYLVGEISGDTFLRFDALLLTAPKVKTVSLASVGGLVLEARLVSALVRKRKLSTYVEFYCASACTQIFAAGRERVLGKDAKLGFHQGISIGSDGKTGTSDAVTDRKLSPTSVFGLSANDTLRYAYQGAGIEQGFIDKVMEVSHDTMWLPTTQELRDARVITRAADHAEVPLPAGTYSLADITAMQAGKPLWQAAATYVPEQYAKALVDVWMRANSGNTLAASIAWGRNTIISAGTHLLARSSDQVLDRMLTLYGDLGRSQRARGYPTCKPSKDDAEPAVDPIDQQFDAGEDALMAQVLAEPKLLPAMAPAEADKIFNKEIAPIIAERYSLRQLKSTEGSCRFGFEVFVLIDALPAKKRLKVFRAVLSLPD